MVKKRFVTDADLIAKNKVPKTTTIETFRHIGFYELHNLTKEKFNCANGIVDILKYRVTVEPIVEPMDVYHERLQNLWDHCDNYHNEFPLRQMAELFGYTFVGLRGNKVTKMP